MPVLRSAPLAACALLAALAGGVLRAGETSAPPVARPSFALKSDDLPNSVGLIYAHWFRTDIARSDAHLAVDRATFFADSDLKLAGPWSLEIDLMFDVSNYRVQNFGTVLPIGAQPIFLRSPIREAYDFRVDAIFAYRMNPSWRILAGPRLEIAAASGADLGESVTFGGTLAVEYTFRDKTSVALGATVSSRLEGKTTLFPYLRINPGFANFEKVDFEALLNGGRVRYSLTRQFSVFAQASYDAREYRLSRRGSLPGGVWREKSIPVAAGLSWQPNKHFSFNAFGGAAFARELDLLTRDGGRYFRRDTSITPIAGADLRVNF